MDDEEVKDKMYVIRDILSKFWQDDFISSYTVDKIIEQFPPRLKEL